MPLTIAVESPISPDGRTLVQGSEAAIRSVLAEDECFTFTADELVHPDITFFVARQNGQAVGCVALCDYETYAEVKRLFVTPAARGTGAARALMAHLESAAKNKGQQNIRLETAQVLSAGVALYMALGYCERGPFGDYKNIAASHFMEKTL
jgi:putative acetyltransferase